ncbi:MAG: hypothetical protein ABH804_02310 [archaeon]
MERITDYPREFDLNDFSIADFFSNIAFYLDFYATGKTEKLEEEDYEKIAHASEILRKKSRDFRRGNKKSSLEDGIFFWEFYGKKEEESNVEESRELSADRLMKLSEELAIIDDLSKEKIKKLRDIFANLSRETMKYWNSKHPYGFKKYIA